MAGNIKMPSNPLDLKIMHIQNLRKFRGNLLQFFLEKSILHDLVAGFNGCRFALDMGENRRNLKHFASHF